MTQCFQPSVRSCAWLVGLGAASLGYALHLRYNVIEDVPTGLACDAGLQSFGCVTRRLGIVLNEHQVFGGIALAAALLNVLRPSVVLFSIGLAATGLGLVLHNGALAGLAAGLLILSFARPVTETI